MYITSAKGLLSLLEEPDDELKFLALQRLADVVDVFWPEIADSVDRIEEIYENELIDSKNRQLAALVASKVYYHMGSYDVALDLALGSNVLFGPSAVSSGFFHLTGVPSGAAVPKRGAANTTSRNAHLDYVATMVGKCIDSYIEVQKKNNDRPAAEIARFENDPELRVESVSPRAAKAARRSESTTISSGGLLPVDHRKKDVVQKLFEQCLEKEQYRQAIGLAIESRRVDLLRKTLVNAIDTDAGSALARNVSPGNSRRELLRYTLQVVMSVLEQKRNFRQRCLELLVEQYLENLKKPDLIQVTQCLISLDNPGRVAKILSDLLLKASDQDESWLLLAYQIAFDLYENAPQHFLTRVISKLDELLPGRLDVISGEPRSPDVLKSEDTGSLMDTGVGVPDSPPKSFQSPSPGILGSADTPLSGDVTPSPLTVSRETTAVVGEGATAVSGSEMGERAFLSTALPPMPPDTSFSTNPTRLATGDFGLITRLDSNKMKQLREILAGNKTRELYLQFLIRSNHSDLVLLRQMKDAVRTAVHHNAAIISNGLAHFGTTEDSFLRDNLEWLGRATHWARFSATASLGVIHFAHEKDPLKLMAAYLPRETNQSSSGGFAEGGSLYALGLIHANHANKQILDYLQEQLKQGGGQQVQAAGAVGPTTDPVKHGACLALGLAGMGTARHDLYEVLKTSLDQDEAVLGESAALAAGLLMLGTASDAVFTDLLQTARESQHEKILRGIAVGIALLFYLRQEDADSIIETLLAEKDPLLRWSGAYTIAMAYAGTGSNEQLQKLLHIAVSDVNDDVRRAAVISIGFLLFRQSEQCPPVVSLLTESYNANVRYGAAMALGIACAGTGQRDAIALLEPLFNDQVNFVRQGALIACAIIMIGHNQHTCPKTVAFREQIMKVIQDKHEDVLTKFGATMGLGLLDAGGRNVTISLQSRTGQTNMQAVVGLLLFQHFWYWFPMAHTIALAFTPNCLITLNSNLDEPKMQFKSCARASHFAYPPLTVEKHDKTKEKIDTAVLSVTAKAKRKEEEKLKAKQAAAAGASEVSAPTTPAPGVTTASPPLVQVGSDTLVSEPMDTDTKSKSDEKPKEGESAESKEKEKPFEMLNNPARVLPSQLRFLQLPNDARYKPLKDISAGGIIMVTDDKAGEAIELVEPVRARGPLASGDDAPEPEPPAPFVYTFTD